VPPLTHLPTPHDFADVDLTYPDVGGSLAEVMPPGYRHLDRTILVGVGRGVHERAAEALLTWQLHRRAGARVAADSPRAEPGAVVVLSVGLGPVRIAAPCRVVRVVQEPDADGFAYGTLPGHPERGEESFVVRSHPDGRVTFTVRAFSRHATRLARAVPPATGLAQQLATRHYLRVLKKLATRP